MSVTPRKTRSQGPADEVDLDHFNGTHTPAKSGWFDVETELAFYSSYHSTRGNKIIHFIFIPLIAWSTLILAAHVHLPGAKAITLFPGFAFQPSLALLLAVGYQIYYLLLEPLGGLSFLPISVLLYTTSTYLFAHPPSWLPFGPSSLPFGLIMNVSSWISQFIGHAVYEHRAPALLDNPRQAFVLAPFFVHLEMMFTAFGYKPELARSVKNKAAVRIRDMHRLRAKKTI